MEIESMTIAASHIRHGLVSSRCADRADGNIDSKTTEHCSSGTKCAMGITAPKKGGAGSATNAVSAPITGRIELPMTIKHSHALASTSSGADVQARAAATEGHLCSPGCPHLRETVDGAQRCEAFDLEPLHPSFEAPTMAGSTRAERCTWCLVAEVLFGGAR